MAKKKYKCIVLHEPFTIPKLKRDHYKVTKKEMKYIRKFGGVRGDSMAKRIKKRGEC